MKYITFTEKEKVTMFDKIASHFYNSNFGKASKSDIELLMFNFYIQKLIDSYKEDDNTIDYNRCSDYLISKELGITQSRVRSLKVKNHLANPIDFQWEKAFVKLINNARYDKDSHKVTINIPDPNLYLEIQNYIEENGAYVEKQLNSKILQIRAEYFIALVVESEEEKTRQAVIKELKQHFSAIEKSNFVFDEQKIGKTLIDSAEKIGTIVGLINNILSPENIIGTALMKLLTD